MYKNEKIIERLGGKEAVAKKLGISKSAIYLWFYNGNKGCNGKIPPKNALKIYSMAQEKGLDCSVEDVVGDNND